MISADENTCPPQKPGKHQIEPWMFMDKDLF